MFQLKFDTIFSVEKCFGQQCDITLPDGKFALSGVNLIKYIAAQFLTIASEFTMNRPVTGAE